MFKNKPSGLICNYNMLVILVFVGLILAMGHVNYNDLISDWLFYISTFIIFIAVVVLF